MARPLCAFKAAPEPWPTLACFAYRARRRIVLEVKSAPIWWRPSSLAVGQVAVDDDFAAGTAIDGENTASFSDQSRSASGICRDVERRRRSTLGQCRSARTNSLSPSWELPPTALIDCFDGYAYRIGRIELKRAGCYAVSPPPSLSRSPHLRSSRAASKAR